MSELSQQHLRALGLVETNVVRLDKALKAFHGAIMQMDMDQMRIFAKTDLAQQAYALVNTYAQMDEGLQTVGRPYFKEPSAQDGLVCDGCGATTDDFEMPFNANLSINKMHRSLCPSALSCSGTLRPQALRSGPIPTEVSGLQFRHFNGLEDACTYIVRELLDALRDDLIKMEGTEAEHYADEDRATMRLRIADIEQVGPFIERLPESL